MQNVRKYLPYFDNQEISRGGSSQLRHRLPTNSLINSVLIFLEVPYSVGANAPADPTAGGVFDLIRRLRVDDNRPDGDYWDVSGLALKTHCRKIENDLIPVMSFSTATNGGNKTLTQVFQLDFTNSDSPVSKYDSGCSTYYKEVDLIIDWAAIMDGVAFGAHNDLSIDKENIKVRFSYDRHSVDLTHPAITNPELFPMRCLKTFRHTVDSNGQNLEHEYEQGINFVYSHISTLKKIGEREIATSEVLGKYNKILVQDISATTPVTLQQHCSDELKYRTSDARGVKLSEVQAGFRTLPLIDDGRLLQNKSTTKRGDLRIFFENVNKVAAADTTFVDITDEYFREQDRKLGLGA